jgi:hypothetical protein
VVADAVAANRSPILCSRVAENFPAISQFIRELVGFRTSTNSAAGRNPLTKGVNLDALPKITYMPDQGITGNGGKYFH